MIRNNKIAANEQKSPLLTPEDYCVIAVDHDKNRRYRQAIELLEEALQHYENDHWVLYQLSNVHMKKGNFDKSREYLERLSKSVLL